MSALSQSSAASKADAGIAYCFEDLAVGMSASMTRTITESDVAKFATVTGDHNPLHLDPEYAATTIFKERIAHGMLTASFIPAVFATKLPGGGGIYVSQNLKFRAPVKIGDSVTARVEITGLIPEKHFATFKTQCFVGDKLVVDGEATLLVPSRQ